MKNSKFIVLILALALFGAGCSSGPNKSSDESEAPADIFVPGDGEVESPPGSGTDTGGSNSANTVTFKPVSMAAMNDYVGRSLNNPTDIKVTVALQNDGKNRFYGQVVVGYTENGFRRDSTFFSGTNVNPYLQYSNSNGVKEYAYNVWFKNPTDKQYGAFSGYFQDAYGSVVLVIDKSTNVDQGDGQGGVTTYGGSVWYKNFKTVPFPWGPYGPQGPARKCWFITEGPYQCSSNAVIYKNGLYPTDTYRKLGTFTGLSKAKAFRN